MALYEPPYQCCRGSTSKCRAASLGCAQGFVGGISVVRSSPRNEPSTVACRCHQCTRRTHLLLKDKISMSALLFHKSYYGQGISLTVIKVFQNCWFWLYFVMKRLILFPDPKHIQWFYTRASFISHEIEMIWIPIAICRVWWNNHHKLSQLQAFWYRVFSNLTDFEWSYRPEE